MRNTLKSYPCECGCGESAPISFMTFMRPVKVDESNRETRVGRAWRVRKECAPIFGAELRNKAMLYAFIKQRRPRFWAARLLDLRRLSLLVHACHGRKPLLERWRLELEAMLFFMLPNDSANAFAVAAEMATRKQRQGLTAEGENVTL